jgi:hypothetical protein
MAMLSANPPVHEMHRLIDAHGPARVAQALFGALVSRRRNPRVAVPDTLRADVGLPPVEREMRRHWDVR